MFPVDMAFLDEAEIVLELLGIALVFIGIASISLGRRWRETFRLPDPPEHRLEMTDLLIALIAFLLLPGVFLGLFDVLSGLVYPGSMPNPRPSGLASPPPMPRNVVANVAGQTAAVVLLVYLGKARFPGGLAAWGLRWDRVGARLVHAVLAYVALWPACAFLLALTVWIIRLASPGYTPQEHDAIRMLQAADQPPWVLGTTVASALVLAPVVEELFFRGLLQPAVAKWWRSQWHAIIFCSGAFGLFHWEVGYTIPALAFFGLVLGYCYAKTRSLALVILLHGVFNARTVLWVLLSR